MADAFAADELIDVLLAVILMADALVADELMDVPAMDVLLPDRFVLQNPGLNGSDIFEREVIEPL